tara:strand:- start:1165 stop:2292 length:1128 start_codon:yes stop_codon:yes gene_type:complete
LRFQYILLLASYALLKPFVKKESDTWVIGVEEIATVLINMANALPNSVSVNLFEHRFYNFTYNYSMRANRGFKLFKLVVLSPLLLAYLSAKYDKFIYIGAGGFLLSVVDARELEFSFLNKRNKKIVCYFAGSEIRSFKLLEEYGVLHEMDVAVNYQRFVDPDLASDSREAFRKRLAEVSEIYSDVIFNPAVDQMAYFQRPTHSCLYFCPESLFNKNSEKFINIKRVKIVHAPSSPIPKGTPLVRAAIKKLKMEGYEFDYVELTDMPHERIIAELRDAHIVLNQFYCFIPSIFGMEALASHTVMLTSADEFIETSLEKGSNTAWCVTPYWMVYDNLKRYLDKPEDLQTQADRGFDWCKEHYSINAGRTKLLNILEA